MATNTIVINGKVYDATTGLPVAAPDTPKPAKKDPQPVVEHHAPVAASSHHASHAKTHHQRTQKSVTLRREALKKPAQSPTVTVSSARRKPTAGHVAKSPHVTKFAPHPQPVKSFDIQPQKSTVKPQSSPVRTHTPPVAQRPVVQKAEPLSSRHVKEKLLAHADSAPVHKPTKKRGLFSANSRKMSFATAALALMVFGGYLTYLNMPSLSVRVAASQADIAASFPDYHPDGYRFNGPVAYAPGQVAIQFQSSGSDLAYTVTQQKSSWNSEAVYDNLVAQVAGEDYTSHSQQGLTIYTFGNRAAWVNKGLLYTVDGDAPLSDEQLLRIAGSM